MEQGWIKIHRKVLDNPIVCKDSDYMAVWIYLLLNATHKKIDAIFKGKRITLEEGQLITGRKAIAKTFDIQESKVKRILLELENDQQIIRERSNLNSLITIVKWKEYQSNDQQGDQLMTSKRPASDHKQECKNNIISFINKEIKVEPKPKKDRAEFDVIKADPLLQKYLEEHKGEKETDDLIEDYFWEGLAR